MFKFWWKKEDPDKKLYPSFQARLFAVLVDAALFALVITPILSLISPSTQPSIQVIVILNIAQLCLFGLVIFIFWLKNPIVE